MADIQTLLGEDYREGMTVEEINAVLANRQLVDPTTLPKSVEKTVFDKTASELAKVKKELAELKNSNMTDDEKVQAAITAANNSITPAISIIKGEKSEILSTLFNKNKTHLPTMATRPSSK